MGTPTTSAELTSEIATLTAKALSGTISDEELRRGLRLLREERMTIKPGGGKKKPADGDAELAELENL